VAFIAHTQQQQQSSHTPLWLQQPTPRRQTSYDAPKSSVAPPNPSALLEDDLDAAPAGPQRVIPSDVDPCRSTTSEGRAVPAKTRVTQHMMTRRQMSTSHQVTMSEQEFDDVLRYVTMAQQKQLRQQQDLQDHQMQISVHLRSVRSLWLKNRPNLTTLEQAIDLMAGVMIVINAIIMGFLMDKPDINEGPWLAVKCGFAMIFWVELILKVSLFGCRQQYCGRNAISNLFDSFLILTDSVDILLSLFRGKLPGGNSVLVLRTIRLLRVVRLFRIFRAPVFNDLIAMVHALRAGSATLLWSVVFFVCFIYVTSLLFRAIFGPTPEEQNAPIDPSNVQFYFQSVGRSMLTTYRCSFGDCSTKAGAPILELNDQKLGTAASLGLCGLFFLCTVGLFNIISAVFLERIISYATTKGHDQLRERLHDKRLFLDNVSRFLDLQLQLDEQATYNTFGEIEEESLHLNPSERKEVGYKWLTKISSESLVNKNFPKKLLDLSVEFNSEAKLILADLDIEPLDCMSLSDTLDKNMNGRIDAMELVTGLSRLRGPARRSDIVAVDLTLQSMQSRIDEIWLHQKQQQYQHASSNTVNI